MLFTISLVTTDSSVPVLFSGVKRIIKLKYQLQKLPNCVISEKLPDCYRAFKIENRFPGNCNSLAFVFTK